MDRTTFSTRAVARSGRALATIAATAAATTCLASPAQAQPQAPDLPSVNAGWSAATVLAKGAPAWQGQDLYLVGPDGEKHDMGRVGRTEQVQGMSTDGRFVATTKTIDTESQTVRITLRDLQSGTVRTTDLPEVSSVAFVDGAGSQLAVERGYDETQVETYDRDLDLVAVLRGPGHGHTQGLATDQAGESIGMLTDDRLHLVDPATGRTQRTISPPKGYGECSLDRFLGDGHGGSGDAVMTCTPTSGSGVAQVFAVPTESGSAARRLTKGTPPAGFGWDNAWPTASTVGDVATERLECGAEDVHELTGTGTKDVNTGFPTGQFRTLDVVGTDVIGLGGIADCGADATALTSHDVSTGENTTLLSGGYVRSAVVMPYAR